jgi:hypothetical protein
MGLRLVSGNTRINRLQQRVKQNKERMDAIKQEYHQLRSETKDLESKIREECRKQGKRPPVDRIKQLGYYVSQFEKDPSPSQALRQVKLARQASIWDGLSLLGIYLEQYTERHGREWRGSSVGLKQLYIDLKQLHQRVGDEAVDAIEAVFGEKMAWVTNELGLLMSVDGYERWIVPAITAMKRADGRLGGEQSEWGLERTAVSCVEEIDF